MLFSLYLRLQGFMTNICSKPCVDISILSGAYINKWIALKIESICFKLEETSKTSSLPQQKEN
ncbi:hypothetical protein H8356DRAFT_1352488 [Neocallimastix lanati (nom. inval.)]|nr:hypothetical protein H8356DRAFT_1352488 [Neocallimastix sp. JGI-2020a]